MAARSQIAGTLPSQETGQGVCWGAIPSLEPCHGIPDGVHCVSWSLASQRLRSGSDRCVRRNRRTAALDYISSASCTPSRRTTSAVTAGGVAADTRGAAGLAGAEGRVDSCHVGSPSFNPTRERWTIGIPVDHTQTPTGFGNGQVGLSDCPAARDRPSHPRPHSAAAFVLLCRPPGSAQRLPWRVWKRCCGPSAKAQCAPCQQHASLTLPALLLSKGWLTLDRHGRLPFEGKAIRDVVPVGLVWSAGSPDWTGRECGPRRTPPCIACRFGTQEKGRACTRRLNLKNPKPFGPCFLTLRAWLRQWPCVTHPFASDPNFTSD